MNVVSKGNLSTCVSNMMYPIPSLLYYSTLQHTISFEYTDTNTSMSSCSALYFQSQVQDRHANREARDALSFELVIQAFLSPSVTPSVTHRQEQQHSCYLRLLCLRNTRLLESVIQHLHSQETPRKRKRKWLNDSHWHHTRQGVQTEYTLSCWEQQVSPLFIHKNTMWSKMFILRKGKSFLLKAKRRTTFRA